MLLKPYWMEGLDLAEHIWPHLDWIAHTESQLLGDWLSVFSQAVTVFGDTVFMLFYNNAPCVYLILQRFSFFFISERPLVTRSFGQDKQVDKQL